jgi:hypothetical protein
MGRKKILPILRAKAISYTRTSSIDPSTSPLNSRENLAARMPNENTNYV